MKTVIVQSLWGDGILCDLWRSNRSELGIRKYCIPSVRRYADRHGYSYVLHRTDTPHFRFSIDEKAPNEANQSELNAIMSRDHFNSCFECYYVMNELSDLYERFIYLDLDVYIKPNAPAMPHTKGVWAFYEWQRTYEYDLRRGFADVPEKHRFNTGVLVMDSKGVKSMYDYLCHVKPDSRCTSDQDYFRLWSVKNKVNHLDGVWNHMALHTLNRKGHFIHYAGEKRLIALENAPLYLRPFYLCDYKLPYLAMKSVERSIRRTRVFQYCRRLWKKRARA